MENSGKCMFFMINCLQNFEQLALWVSRALLGWVKLVPKHLFLTSKGFLGITKEMASILLKTKKVWKKKMKRAFTWQAQDQF